MIASATSDSNRIISSTEESWGSVREGSYFKFTRDNVFYNVAKVKPIFYIKPFIAISNIEIEIEENNQVLIFAGDSIKISYKEYQLLTVVSPIDRGTGYSKGDILYLDGGVLSFNTFDGSSKPAKVKVDSVSAEGAIIQMSMDDVGKYIKAPEETCNLNEGHGKGARVKVKFHEYSERNIIEKMVVSCSKNFGKVRIRMDSPLPENITDGKISLEKWEMLLSSNYAGENMVGESYELTKDFTPNLNFPLVTKGSFHPESFYNMSINLIEAEFMRLRKEISELKAKAGL